MTLLVTTHPTPDTSSYGTHVNDARLIKQQPQQLAAGDTVRFADRFKFRLARAPITLHAPDAATAAAVGAAAAPLDLQLDAWGPDVTHCVVEEDGALGAAVASALLNGVAVVTAAWLDALRSRKVWSGQLPAYDAHAPSRLTLTTADGPVHLELEGWEPPAENLLADWTLLVDDTVRLAGWVGGWWVGFGAVAPGWQRLLG